MLQRLSKGTVYEDKRKVKNRYSELIKMDDKQLKRIDKRVKENLVMFALFHLTYDKIINEDNNAYILYCELTKWCRERNEPFCDGEIFQRFICEKYFVYYFNGEEDDMPAEFRDNALERGQEQKYREKKEGNE